MVEAWRKYFDPQVLERLRGLQLATRRVAGGMLVGSHRSPQHGQAIEFSEYRQYSMGDDPRQIDWKVLGRTDKYYLRQREDETSITCHLLVDCSGSMAYRGPDSPEDKLTFGFQLAASLAFVAVTNHDSVSLDCLDTQWRPILGAGTGNDHLMAMADAMSRVVIDTTRPGGDASICWSEGVQRCGSHGIIVLISDFFDEPDELQRTLRALRQTGRETIVIQVIDRAEKEFTFGQTIEYLGMEGEPAIVVDSRGVARSYREAFAKHCQAIRGICLEAGATYWDFLTDEPLRVKLPMLIANR